MSPSESQVQGESSRVEEGKFVRRIANALGAAALYAESPSVIDRMANAVNMESVLRAFYDAERIIEVGLNKGEIVILKKRDKKGGAIIKVRNRVIYGSLPRPGDLEKFVEAVKRDISIARRVASRAIISYNLAVSRSSESAEQQAGGGGG